MFIIYKILSYIFGMMHLSRVIFSQKISDKKFGATYITILGSMRNFWMISVGNVAIKMISGIGYEKTFAVFAIFNFASTVFFRNGYIEFLKSKKPEDFSVELKEKEKKKSE